MPYRLPTHKDWLVTWLTIGVFVAVVLTGAFLIGRSHPIGFLALVGALLLLLGRWHAAISAYQCPNCGHQFEISALLDLVSPHTPGSKYLRCPECGKRDWASVLRKSPGAAAS